MKQTIVLISFLFLNITCVDDNPIDGKQENRSPVILSLSVFPDAIGPSDSAIVICNAMDPDGDTLVYDWVTDGKSRITWSDYPDWHVYNTYENWRVAYPKNLNNVPIDTCWVQVFARNRKGKSDVGLVSFILKKDSL
ncbi:MAG: hypothetical protein STSR0008_18440 [Ignavibacterium sp.]